MVCITVLIVGRLRVAGEIESNIERERENRDLRTDMFWFFGGQAQPQLTYTIKFITDILFKSY